MIAAIAIPCGCSSPRTEYERIASNPVPASNGETVVWRAPGVPAKAALIAVSRPATQVASDLGGFLEAKWGREEWRPRDLPEGAVAWYRTKPFHTADNAFSTLFVYVYVFPDMQERTLISLQREDQWRSWAKEFHTGIRLPFRGWSRTHVVTKEDLDLLVAHLGRNARVAVAFPENWFDATADGAAISTLRNILATKSAPDAD